MNNNNNHTQSFFLQWEKTRSDGKSLMFTHFLGFYASPFPSDDMMMYCEFQRRDVHVL